MASYHEEPEHKPDRRKSSSATPSMQADVPPQQRDACALGTTPDLQPSPPSLLEPDASRTLPYPPHVYYALQLFDAIADLGVGDPTPQLHQLSRATFDALPGETVWFAAVGDTAEAFWTKTLKTPGGQRCPVFTWEPPVETEAAA